MKNYFFIFITCSLLLCCHHEQNEPIIPEEPKPEPEAPYVMPCGCGDEWPQEETICDRELPWNYPIGTEEWNKMTTHQEALEACQIPEEILASLSTDDLTELCLMYPFFVEALTVYPSYELGLIGMFRDFNGIRELYQRKDVAKALLKKYRCLMQRMSILNGPALNVEKGLYICSIFDTELLLSHYQSPDDSKENYIEILQQLVCGHEKRLMHPEFYMGRVFYARAKMLVKIDEQNLESIPQGGSNDIFLKGRCDELTERAINDLSCQYITN